MCLQLQDQRAAAAKAEADAAEQKRAAFVEMLDSKAALLEGARYSKVEALFFEDKRFEALPDATRQSAFSEWQDSRRRKVEEEERNALNAKVRPLQLRRPYQPVTPETGCEHRNIYSHVQPVLCRWTASRSCWRSGRRARTRC